MRYVGNVYRPRKVNTYLCRFGIILSLLITCSCYNEMKTLDSQTPEEREKALILRKKELSQRWNTHSAEKESQKTASIEDEDTQHKVDEKSITAIEKVIAMKEDLVKTVQGAKEKSENTILVIESLNLMLDMEAEGLRKDFAKAKLEIVEVGNHLECSLLSTDDEFNSLRQQSYEIEWWYQGKKVTKKASQYCSGATLGIGLNSGGPSCPHHIKGAFYPYMAINYNQTRQDNDLFQCGLSFAFSMNAAIQKHLADNPFPELKSEDTTWSRWPELKKQSGRPWDFKGTELDCGKDGPQGHRCHLIEEW